MSPSERFSAWVEHVGRKKAEKILGLTPRAMTAALNGSPLSVSHRDACELHVGIRADEWPRRPPAQNNRRALKDVVGVRLRGVEITARISADSWHASCLTCHGTLVVATSVVATMKKSFKRPLCPVCRVSSSAPSGASNPACPQVGDVRGVRRCISVNSAENTLRYVCTPCGREGVVAFRTWNERPASNGCRCKNRCKSVFFKEPSASRAERAALPLPRP